MAKAAKLWVRKHHLDAFKQQPTFKPSSKNFAIRSKTWSLYALARWLKAPIPPQYAYGKTTQRISAIRQGLRARGTVMALTPTL